MDTYHEQTVNRYYSEAIVMLQNLIPVAHRSRKLKNELQKNRPRFHRKKIWNEAINKVVFYTKTHKHNFKNGKLIA